MQYRKGKANANADALSRAGATGVSLEKGGGVSWNKSDQGESRAGTTGVSLEKGGGVSWNKGDQGESRAGATGVSLEDGGGVSWNKGDQGESTEHDPMNRCQEVESKVGGRIQGCHTVKG